MNKSEVRNLIIQHQEKLIQDLEASAKNFHNDSDLDEDAVKDSEDFSHQDESGEMKLRIKEQLKAAKLDLSLINNLSVELCQKVEVGALVETDKKNFYICIPSVPIDVADKHVIGISNQAPIFFQMRGKKVGDSFKMVNIDYKILAIS